MTTPIAITKNEFFLIIQKESHPIYKIVSKNFIEEYKGPVSIYEYIIKNIETNKSFVLNILYNSSIDYIHDSPFDGSQFYIDSTKKEIYDSLGNLIDNINNKKEANIKKQLSEKQLIYKTYFSLTKSESFVNIKSFDEAIIKFNKEDLIEIVVRTIPFTNEKMKFSDYDIFIYKTLIPLAIKYKIEVNHLKNHSLSSIKKVVKSKKSRDINTIVNHFLKKQNILSAEDLFSGF